MFLFWLLFGLEYSLGLKAIEDEDEGEGEVCECALCIKVGVVLEILAEDRL